MVPNELVSVVPAGLASPKSESLIQLCDSRRMLCAVGDENDEKYSILTLNVTMIDLVFVEIVHS